MVCNPLASIELKSSCEIVVMNIKVRGWTFTHWWVRPVVWIWFRIYHKSVTISEVVPVDWNKPIIFAPTHQNAFTDALCLILPAEYTHNRFIYPLVRADAFGNNSFIDWILTSFHMLPVYRPRDKVDLKKENESVFAACYKILSQNRNLLIHPEGNCVPVKRVRNFKKGLARI
ncbi:MAG: 1-acyl-sn-glycerol-3-phosphate acyltransferase, partial [Balneolaceae bacterium]